MFNKIILSLIICFSITKVAAQEVKFGKISKEEILKIDTASVATVLYKSQKTSYDYRVDDGFVQVTEYFKRIKFNKKEGLSYANVIQKLYDESAKKKEIIVGIKGVTYNVAGGKIEKRKLKSKEIYNEKENKYWKKIKMVLPNVRVGSVIDIKYRVESPFPHQIKDVILQENIPVNEFEYQIKIPEYFTFDVYENIKSNYKISITEDGRLIKKHIKWKERVNRFGGYVVEEFERDLNYKERVIKFNEKNIPALKREKYAPYLNNYAIKLLFDLKSTKSFSGSSRSYATNWDIITDKIHESYSFGEELRKTKYFEKDIDLLLQSALTKNDKMTSIFNYVKSRVKWNNFVGYDVDLGVKKAYKMGEGNVADINLMLIAMLRYAGIEANPILSSTRDNGIPLFPTLQGFNYVLCGVEVENDVLLLDATDQYATINILPKRVLNWQGRIVRKSGSSTWVNLAPKQPSLSAIMLSATLDSDFVLRGKLRTQKTNYTAYDYRKSYAGMATESLIEMISKDKGAIEITNLVVKNSNKLTSPVSQTYEFTSEEGVEEIGNELYISPLLFLAKSDNVFNNKTRNYPVDFVYPFTSKTIVALKLPEGYKIKSVPESIKLEMSDNLGSYSFLVRQNGNSVQVSEIFKLNYPLVPVSYYQELREVYTRMIEKNQEKIVLEKIL